MRPDELAKFFSPRALQTATDLNPLRVAEREYFDRKQQPGQNYREQAIEAVTRCKLPFASTGNSVCELMTQFVSVTCPYCKTPGMEAKGGGGNGWVMSTSYHCHKCAAEVSITLTEGALYATPPKEKKRSLEWILKLRDISEERDIRRALRDGRVTVNKVVMYESVEVGVGDTINYVNGFGKPYEFECTEHDITGQPLSAGGTFTKHG